MLELRFLDMTGCVRVVMQGTMSVTLVNQSPGRYCSKERFPQIDERNVVHGCCGGRNANRRHRM